MAAEVVVIVSAPLGSDLAAKIGFGSRFGWMVISCPLGPMTLGLMCTTLTPGRIPAMEMKGLLMARGLGLLIMMDC